MKGVQSNEQPKYCCSKFHHVLSANVKLPGMYSGQVSWHALPCACKSRLLTAVSAAICPGAYKKAPGFFAEKFKER